MSAPSVTKGRQDNDTGDPARTGPDRTGGDARIVLQGVDRAGVDAVMAAVQAVGEEEWDALVRDHPPG